MLKKQSQRLKRHRKIRAKISGTKDIPRLCVFRSNKYIYAQLIDDENNKILVIANDLKIEKKKNTKKEIAFKVGEELAKKATEKKISKVVFDRGGYLYHGRIKSLAEGARKGGLIF